MISSPELLQLIHIHVHTVRHTRTHTHTCLSSHNLPWAADDFTSNVDDVTSSDGSLSDEAIVFWGVFFFSSSGVRKSRVEEKHAHTSYFSYHLTMKEDGGGTLFTNHHDFTSVVAFVSVWGLADVLLSGGCLLSAPTSEWRQLDPPSVVVEDPPRACRGTSDSVEARVCFVFWWIGSSRCFIMSHCLTGKQQRTQTVRGRITRAIEMWVSVMSDTFSYSR